MTIIITSVVVGIAAFLLLGNLTDWQTLKLKIAVGLLVFAGDLIMAFAMEAVAPTKVSIGPGEKVLNSDMPTESAIVVAGFGASPEGRVEVRGETWQATCSAEETGSLEKGALVRVIDRKGLTLVVAARTVRDDTSEHS